VNCRLAGLANNNVVLDLRGPVESCGKIADPCELSLSTKVFCVTAGGVTDR
jgi:hypothetical protein